MIKKKWKYRSIKVRSGEFIMILMLTLLLDGPSYGYKLIENAGKIGVDPNILGQGVAYRILRKLEMSGMVESYWETKEEGMPRRIYRITEDGKAFLKTWKDGKKKEFEIMEKVVQLIEKKLGA